jgi:hypothetical protein
MAGMLLQIPKVPLRLLLMIGGIVVANGSLANTVWRLKGAKRRGVQRLGRFLATIFALVNLGVTGFALYKVWHLGWDWFYILLMLQASVFVIRFGGARGGAYP